MDSNGMGSTAGSIMMVYIKAHLQNGCLCGRSVWNHLWSGAEHPATSPGVLDARTVLKGPK